MNLSRTSVLLFSLLTIPALAQDAETTYEHEWRELERGIESYTKVRDQELMVIERLQGIASDLQDSAYDANIPIAGLRQLDQELGEAWDEAYALSRRTSELRSGLYDQMDFLAQLAREMELYDTDSGKRSGPAGHWRFEASPSDVTGVMELELVGSQINGQYSASNGNLVLLRGRYNAGHLKLQRLGDSLEILGEIVGDFDADTGELSGTWNSRELSSGRPTQGQWRAWPVQADSKSIEGRGPRD